MKDTKRNLICCFFIVFFFICINAKVVSAVEKRDATTQHNQSEITVYPFSYFEDFLSYVNQKGQYEYNHNFTGIDKKRYIRLNVLSKGTLMVVELSDDNLGLTILDQNKKKIGTMNSESSYLRLHTDPGTYYIQLPTTSKTIRLTAMMYNDHLPQIKAASTSLQSGTGQYVYHTFQVSGRRQVVFEIEPLFSSKIPVKTVIQKQKNGTWSTVTKQKSYSVDSDTATLYGLNKGAYRIAIKTSSSQGYTMVYHAYKKTDKYQTKKSKATKIKTNGIKNQMFTVTEQKARWYKINRKTKKGKHYLTFTSDLNSGNLKIYLYKKGVKKPIKKMTLKQGKKSETKKFRLRYGVGTYYMKIYKSTKKANGNYYIYYSKE